MIGRWMAGASVAIVLGAWGVAGADGPDAAEVLPSGFEPHIRDMMGGRVDWANGYVIAEGKGNAYGKTNQDRLMAKRAAHVVAARNALAIVMGLQVDGDGRFADVQGGEVRLRGVVKRHETISVDWRPNKTPPECRVQLKVPIWGVKGVASVAYTAQVQKSLRSRRRRPVLATASKDVSDEVLVIDAREMEVRPCLFPLVVEPDGGVIYDVATITHRQGRYSPPVRYVETALTYEQLRVCLEGDRGAVQIGEPNGGDAEWGAASIVGLAYAGGWSSCSPADEPVFADDTQRTHPRSQPTSRPTSRASEPSRRRRRRVIRAVRTTGENKTKIVLTQEDADKLRKDAKGASLLRNGQVIVVVDSVAAGIEGRRDDGLDDAVVALSNER